MSTETTQKEQKKPYSLTSQCIDDVSLKNDWNRVACRIIKLKEIIANANNLKSETDIHGYEQDLAWNEQMRAELEEVLANYPELPVLPPPGEVVRITGVIEEVESVFAKACFHLGGYSHMANEIARKNKHDNIGKTITAGLQVLAGGPPIGGSSTNFNQRSPAYYIKGKIDGVDFSGWFKSININAGDNVEMAVVKQDGHYLSYGIAKLEDKTIILPPECYSEQKQRRFWIYILPVAIFCLPFTVGSVINEPYDAANNIFLFILITLAFGLVIRHVAIKDNNQFWALYEVIDHAIDLKRYTLYRQKKNKKKQHPVDPNEDK